MRREPHRLGAQVLEEERHAPERPARQPRPDRLARAVLLHQHHGVEGGVALGDALESGVQKLVRRDFALGHQGSKPGGVVIVVLHGSPCRRRSARLGQRLGRRQPEGSFR
jgi:hypothetical protein